MREMLDLHEGRLDVPLLDSAAVVDLLRSARRIAVVGASPHRERPSNEILRYLADAGYEVVPIHPNWAEIEGLPCYPNLAEAVAANGPVDIVDVFRRPEFCPDHARQAVAAGARCLWLQLGIVSADAARIAAAAGLGVVMDRCIMVDHRRLALHRPDMSR